MLIAMLLSIKMHQDASAQTIETPSQRHSLDRILTALPEATETITINRDPSTVSRDPDLHKASDLVEALDRSSLALFLISDGILQKPLAPACRLELAVESSMHFRAPIGLGPMHYSAVQVVMFSPHSSISPRDVLTSLKGTTAASQVLEENNEGIVKLAVSDVEFPESIYVRSISKDTLVYSNSLRYLRSTVAKLQGKSTIGFRFREFPEWKYIDKASDVYILRHFRREDTNQDPTSPYSKSSMTHPDNGAQGIAFSYNKATNAARLVYLTANSDGSRLASEVWRLPMLFPNLSDTSLPPSKSIGTNAYEVMFKLASAEERALVHFLLMTRIRHGAVL